METVDVIKTNPAGTIPVGGDRGWVRAFMPLACWTAALLAIALPFRADAAMSPSDALALLNGLTVASESRCTPYDRDDYRYGQDEETRMIREYGGVFGPYEMRWFESRRETDIEHIVAASEAHDSGMCARSAGDKAAFAADDGNLTLASAHLNRNVKGANDFTDWRPAHNACWMAGRIVDVRSRWRLTIDRRERDALARVLSGCASLQMVVR